MTLAARLRGASSDWLTPPYLLAAVRDYFTGPIPLDPATEPDNPTEAAAFYSPPQDGLALPWGAPAFVNPPYSGGALPRWLARIAVETARGLPVLALLPCGARFGTRYWQRDVFTPALRSICFVRGRVRFLDPVTREPRGSNPYDSAVWGWNVDALAFARAFGPLGACLAVVEADLAPDPTGFAAAAAELRAAWG